MASHKAETGLRIADGVLVLVLALITLFMAWLPGTDILFGIVLSVMAALALLFGVVVLVGKTKAGPVTRTRRRWKYVCLLVYIVLMVIMIIVTISVTSGHPSGNGQWGLFPALLALFLVQLYEPVGTGRSTASSLNDGNARAYRRIGLLALLGGIVLGGMGVLAAVAGNPTLPAQLFPPAVFCLVFAVGIWMMLRSRRQQGSHQ
ncbi:hypothetical protein GCM10023063_42610 [Arthrobacter methylotrophus]|uniref:Uncharacterized protein n=1 Tax=Arthrobacter methylotrophus TaxID=121291 RepID=A0ABV5UX63_9MICC